jgi:hypothetical protein
MGRVLRVGADEMALEAGTLPAGPGHVTVDCSAAGLRITPGRPIFKSDRITLQQVRTCQPTFNAALIAFVETARNDDGERNRLCPPNPYPDAATDWIKATYTSQGAQAAWQREPDIGAWLEAARLDAARGMRRYMSDPQMQSALRSYVTNMEPALTRLEQFLVPAA